MMYLPSDKILEYTKEVDEWSYFDSDSQSFKLRDNAPDDIKEKEKLIKKDLESNAIY